MISFLEVFDNPIDNGKTPKDPNFKVEDYENLGRQLMKPGARSR